MNRTVRSTLRRTAEAATIVALSLAAVSSHAQESMAGAASASVTLPMATSFEVTNRITHRLAPTIVRVDLEPELPLPAAPTAAAVAPSKAARVSAPAAKKPAPRSAPASSATRPAPPKLAATVGASTATRFAFGYCTWWVAHKRFIPWLGNAAQWWWNARAFGYAEGQTPRVGAIMVMAAGGSAAPQGHVAYVESVNGDGSFVVSEMNWWGVPGGGWGRVDYRRVTSMRGILGFIY